MPEPTVSPLEDADAEEREATTHSLANTREVAQSIQSLLKDDDEGELEAYDKLTTVGKSVWFKVIDTDADLAYKISVEPLDD